jgi:hypothetical protein
MPGAPSAEAVLGPGAGGRRRRSRHRKTRRRH